MADRIGSFGRSNSMPLMGLGKSQHSPKEIDQHKWKHALLSSPGLQRFRDNTASVWAPNGVQFLDPVMPHFNDQVEDDADGEDARSQSSASTVRMDVGKAGSESLGFDGGVLLQCPSSANEPTCPSSPWNPIPTNGKPHSRASSADSDDTFMTDYSLTQSIGSVDSSGYLHVPEALHRRRDSSKFSSLPAVPSPLGTGRVTNEAVSDGSGLMSTSPNSPHSCDWTQAHDGIRSPSVRGLHQKIVGYDSKGGPLKRPAWISFGHCRNATDPFIERAQDLPCGLPDAMQRAVYLDVHSPSSSAPLGRAGLPPNPLSVTQGGEARTAMHPAFAPSGRTELPIPPRPLPFVQHNIVHTVQTRAILDAQKVIREDWIRTEARKITELNRARFEAAQQFQRTYTREDYDTWSRAEAAFMDATTLEQRQEERRNMFLAQGMTAMRTGPGNISSDGSASFPTCNQTSRDRSNGGEGAGRLLGFQMALMERVCAEVQRGGRDGDEGEAADEITAGMLDTLSIAEKLALKQHLVTRLQRATDRRSCD
ncbi:hypothetical protein NX059_006839 [Plenodomus lindquistii]|nr:hypothetical protein NX059_006839 [Plenodomus lindquistii]